MNHCSLTAALPPGSTARLQRLQGGEAILKAFGFSAIFYDLPPAGWSGVVPGCVEGLHLTGLAVSQRLHLLRTEV